MAKEDSMREADFQWAVIEIARLKGWRVAHFRPARTRRGWRTPVAADGKGYPDLTLVRERIVYAELKAEKGQLTHEQEQWIQALQQAGAEAYVWRPSDWSAVLQVLD